MADDNSTALVIMKGDTVVGKISSDILPILSPIMQRVGGGGGGGDGIATFADAAEAGLAFVEAMGIRDDIDDARDGLADLKDARGKLYTYLSTTGAIGGSQLASLLRDVDIAQDSVDRAQTRAQNKATTVIWGQVFGGIGRLLGRAQSGGSGIANLLGIGGNGGGGSSFSSMLLGGGIGALLASMFTSRPRDVREEDDANVPPLP